MKKFQKITTGVVIQNYVTLDNGASFCESQEFDASDTVGYEDENGNNVTVDTLKEVYCPFTMVQPPIIPSEEDSIPSGFEEWFEENKNNINIKKHYEHVLKLNQFYPLNFKQWAVKYYKL